LNKKRQCFLGEIGGFLKNQCHDQILAQTSGSVNKNRPFFAILGKNIFQITTSIPEVESKTVHFIRRISFLS
jgi:hypothetical protein